MHISCVVQCHAALMCCAWYAGGAKGAACSDHGTVSGANKAVARAHVSSGVETYDCPVCRKAQVLDVDRLQVSLVPCLMYFTIYILIIYCLY